RRARVACRRPGAGRARGALGRAGDGQRPRTHRDLAEPAIPAQDASCEGAERRMSAREPRHLYRRLLREARPFWMHIAGLLVLAVISSVLTLLVPLPLKLAVDSVIGSRHLPAPLDALPDAISGSRT